MHVPEAMRDCLDLQEEELQQLKQLLDKALTGMTSR